MRNCEGSIKHPIKTVLSVILAVSVITAAYYGAVAAFQLIELRLHPVKYAEYVEYYAKLYGVPQEIVYAVILTESRFDPDAVSHAGACGLMQLMPETYKTVAGELERIPDERAVFDPGMNICCGVYLLAKLFHKYGKWETAYAAYNAGENAVDRWLADPKYSDCGQLSHIPYKETAGYVKKVCHAAESYKKIYGF